MSFVIFLSGCGDLEEGDLSSLTVAPSSTTVGVNQTKNFTVTGRSSSGFLISVSPSWSETGGIGSVNSNGIFTAGGSAGTGTVVASVGTISDSSAVTVTTNCWIEGRVQNELGNQVSGVSVYLDDTSYSAYTGTDGRYSISGVPAGSYNIGTTDPYGTYRDTTPEAISVDSGETATKNFIIYYYTLPPDLTEPELEIE